MTPVDQASETSGWGVLLFVLVALPVFFVALWTGIVWLLSVLGGWREMARAYPAERRPEGDVFRGVSAMFGFVSYSYLLTVVVAQEGLYLETPRLFRVGQPPMLIPWSAIRRARRHRSFMGFGYVSFDVGDPKIARLRFPERVLAQAPIRYG